MKINLRKRIEPMSLKYNLSDLPTGSESRQSHVEFIRVNLELMLAVAWNGYESEGRGAIVIDVSLSKAFKERKKGKSTNISQKSK